MPFTVYPSGIRCYSAAEIDQLELGGRMASIGNRNAIPITVGSGDWTLDVSGGDFDGWYYADVAHNRTNSPFAMIAAFIGVDDYIHICSGVNDFQQKQDSNTIRLWLKDEPSYDLLCLVVYA